MGRDRVTFVCFPFASSFVALGMGLRPQNQEVRSTYPKSLLYAKTKDEYDDAEIELMEHPTVIKYPQFLKDLQKDVLPRKEKWALSERISKQLCTHNVNTTNYVEISFRITKENQFNRVKAFNLPDLLEIVLDDSQHYVQRCIDVGNNRISQLQNQRSRYLSKSLKCKIDRTKIEVLSGNAYRVPSERIPGKMYDVNMDLGLCQCPDGMLRGPCKHKQIVAEHFNVASSDVIPVNDPEVRPFYNFLATGKNKESRWFCSLHQEITEEGESSASNNADVFNFMRAQDQAERSSVVDVTMNSDDERDIDMHVDGQDDDANDIEIIKQEFKAALDHFKENALKRLEDDPESYFKFTKSFTKQLQCVTTLSHIQFQKALFTFVDEEALPARKGRRKQYARHIPVQKTSRSRRHYKIRGSQGARKGRQRKDIVKPKNTVLSYHLLPPQKKT